MKKLTFILSAIGRDRPGIAADVTELIYECGCNLEDSRMTLLGTHFALLILLTGEGEGLEGRLRKGCKRLEWDKGLTVFLSSLETLDQRLVSGATEADYELRVVGMDRTGIVYRTAKLLADKGINIVDLDTHVDPAPDSGSLIFVMYMKTSVPRDLAIHVLQKDLEHLADELNLEICLSKNPKS